MDVSQRETCTGCVRARARARACVRPAWEVGRPDPKFTLGGGRSAVTSGAGFSLFFLALLVSATSPEPLPTFAFFFPSFISSHVCTSYLLLELMDQTVLLPLQGRHLLLGFLLLGRGQLQQGDVGVLLANGCQQRLLPFFTEEKREKNPNNLSAMLEISIMKSHSLLARVDDINCRDSSAQRSPSVGGGQEKQPPRPLSS